MDDAQFYKDLESRIPALVKTVRKVLKKKHSLQLPEQCDSFVTRILRVQDGKVDKTVRIVATYHDAIVTVDEQWGLVLKPTHYRAYYERRPLQLLSHRHSNGAFLFLFRSSAWDPQEICYENAIMALWMLCEYCSANFPEMQQKGVMIITDFKNCSWEQIWAVNQLRMLTMLRWSQAGVSGKMQGTLVINQPKPVGYIYKIMRPFLKEKVRKRTIFLNSVDELHDRLSPKILPKDLGGILEPEQAFDQTIYDGVLGWDKHFEQILADGFPTW